MERSEMHKRPIGESYNGEADDLQAGNNGGPRKYRGVFPAGKKFRAVMQLDGVRHNLGMYVTEIEAAQAYDRFARDNFKKTNFPFPLGQEPAEHAAPVPIADNQNARVIDRFNNRARAPMNIPRRQKFPSYSWPGADPANGVDGVHPASYASGWADDRNSYPMSQSGYGGGFPSATTGFAGENYQSQEQYGWPQGQHPPMQSHHHHQFQQPRYNDWHQPFWPQESHSPHHHYMYQQQQPQQQLHSSYLPSMAQSSLSMEYIAVPHAIADEVRKYVSDFLLLEQQEGRHHQPPAAQQFPLDQENQRLGQPDQTSHKPEQQDLLDSDNAVLVPLPSLALHREQPPAALQTQTSFHPFNSTLAAPGPVLALGEKSLSQPADCSNSSEHSGAELAPHPPAAASITEEQPPASAAQSTSECG